jgi:hypothetical protein
MLLYLSQPTVATRSFVTHLLFFVHFLKKKTAGSLGGLGHRDGADEEGVAGLQ